MASTLRTVAGAAPAVSMAARPSSMCSGVSRSIRCPPHIGKMLFRHFDQ